MQQRYKQLPLTLAQQDIYFDQLHYSDEPIYNIGGYVRLFAVNLKQLASAHKCLVQAHDAFSIRMLTNNKEPKQAIGNLPRTVFDIIDFSACTIPTSIAKAWLNKLFNTPFKIDHADLFRAYVLKINTSEYWYVGLAHHLCMDGWGFANWVRELGYFYHEGSSEEYSTDTIINDWEQVIEADRAYLKSKKYLADKAFWLDYCLPLPEKLLEPYHLSEFEHKSVIQSGRQIFTLSLEKYIKIKQFAKQLDVSTVQIFIAILVLYFSRVAEQNTLIVGMPIYNRRGHRQKQMIGVFTGVSLLKINIEEQIDFSSFVRHIAKLQKQCYRHQRFPIGHLIRDLGTLEKRTQPYDIGFNYIKFDNKLKIEGLSTEIGNVSPSYVSTPFMMTLAEYGDEQDAEIYLDYSLAYFTDDDASLLASRFQYLIEQFLLQPTQALLNFSIIPVNEQAALKQFQHSSDELNQPIISDTGDYLSLHQLFEYQAVMNPLNDALVFNGDIMSYHQLNQLANQLAHHLIDQGCEQGQLIGVCVEPSVEMIVALLAVLKTGSCYLPLDCQNSKERLCYMIEDSQIHCLITKQAYEHEVKGLGLNHVLLDNLLMQETVGNYPTHNPISSRQVSGSDLAYIIYTSGSTGKPKGVMIDHKAAINFILAMNARLNYSQVGYWLLLTTITFDIALYEWLGCLSQGGCCVIASDEEQKDPFKLARLIEENDFQLIQSTPSRWGQLLDAGLFAAKTQPCTELSILSGGEVLSRDLLKRLMLNGSRIWNCYGPTEATVWSLVKKVDSEDFLCGAIPLGGALNNYSHFVLNKRRELSPIGIIGELYIGGVSLARGYLNQPTLSQERFIPNPFSDDSEERLYQTGDLVRYLVDGNLSFIGRVDDQVKIRGYRIEPGEVEYQLSGCESVKTSLVTVLEEEGEKRLVAYVIPREFNGLDEKGLLTELRVHLQAHLANYMMPSGFVLLEAFPLMVNGKVDKKALPAPDGSLLQDEYIAASSENEKILVEIWAKLLKLDKETISVAANFFELGGHSLLAVRLVSDIRARLQRELAVKTIFDAPTIQALTKHLEVDGDRVIRSHVVSIERQPGEAVIASFAQQRLWFINQLQGSSTEYNMPAAYHVKGEFNVAVAAKAIHRIIKRHESLRTVFRLEDSTVLQVVQERFNFCLPSYDLTGLDEQTQEQIAKTLIFNDRQKTFDLSKDLMLRAAYIQLSTKDKTPSTILLFNLHHIASDGWSIGVLLNEFVAQYQAMLQDKPDPLPPLDIQYADYAYWQRQWLDADRLALQSAYWKQQLAAVPAVHSVTLDYLRPAVKAHQGAFVSSQLSIDISSRLQTLATQHQLTLFMLLHGMLAVVLSRHSNSDDIVMGTPVANRLQTELEPLIGFFVNTLVLRVNTDYESVTDYLKHIRKVNLDALSHQDIPFEQLVEQCQVPRSTQYSPLFQILFTMNSNEQYDWKIPGVEFSSVNDIELVSKFDLDISAELSASGIDFCWVYDISLFKVEHVETLNEHFISLLSHLVESPQSNLSDLSMQSAQEIHYLLHEQNKRSVNYPADKLIHDLFEEQVDLHPSRTALVIGEQSLTYKALNERSNQLAHYFIEQGITTDTLVGLCIERSLEMIVGLLGILKAGGAYVPLDPTYPTVRLAYMLSDTQINHVLTQNTLVHKVNVKKGLSIISLDAPGTADLLRTYSTLNPFESSLQKSSQLAYVVYTSGSTGPPKGVLTTHEGVVRLVMNPGYMSLNTSSRFLQACSLCFDVATLEIWGPLLNGGACVLYPHVQMDLSVLNQVLETQKLNSMWLTAGLFEQWSYVVGGALSLKYLLVGGDIVDPGAVNRVLERLPGVIMINGYGPTEGTTFSCCYPFTAIGKHEISIPIGRSINGTQIYVLSSEKQLSPKYSVGELYIGGSGLARGYLNQPTLSQERFIPNPFSDDSEERLYQTGDLVRYLVDGNLSFIGRVDDQVKIRGYRIEPGEVEYQLSGCELVKTSLVTVLEEEGEKRLVAYVVPKEFNGLDEKGLLTELRAHLQAHLPDYMVPSGFVLLEALPLTVNGKVNKKALPAPDGSLLQGEYIAASSESEKFLIEIWAKLLKLDKEMISITANFFDLGGNSLLLIQLVFLINQEFAINLELSSLYGISNLKMMAEFLDSEKPTNESQIKNIKTIVLEL